MGDKISISGKISNSILNIKSTLTNVQQTVNGLPGAGEADKTQLKQLLDQLQEALQKAPPEKAEQVQAVAETAKALVETAAADKPNKTMLQITGEGLKKAAENLVAVTPAVLTIATQIVTTILGLHGI